MVLTPEQIEERDAKVAGLTENRDNLANDIVRLRDRLTELVAARDQHNGAIQILVDLDNEPEVPTLEEVLVGGLTKDENGLDCLVVGSPVDEASSEEESPDEE